MWVTDCGYNNDLSFMKQTKINKNKNCTCFGQEEINFGYLHVHKNGKNESERKRDRRLKKGHNTIIETVNNKNVITIKKLRNSSYSYSNRDRTQNYANALKRPNHFQTDNQVEGGGVE